MLNFLGEVWTELTKVVWPTKRETVKYTIIVIIFSIVVAIFLGMVDLGILAFFEKVVK